jgi:Zn-dependent M28 family amino/carboxypeptidase
MILVFWSVCQIVVVGAHLDSWDVGQGAHDDGQGCMIAWEAVRLLKHLGTHAHIDPRTQHHQCHTRWMNDSVFPSNLV